MRERGRGKENKSRACRRRQGSREPSTSSRCSSSSHPSAPLLAAWSSLRDATASGSQPPSALRLPFASASSSSPATTTTTGPRRLRHHCRHRPFRRPLSPSVAVAHTRWVVLLLLFLHTWVLDPSYSGVDAYPHVRHSIVHRMLLNAVVPTRFHCGVHQESAVLFRVLSVAEESPVGRIAANTIVRLCTSNA